MIHQAKKLEIFCGTGGVGKTTLAASRALFLSQQGVRVLLITIDPSKRLKEVLSIDDQHVGKIAQISFSLNDGHTAKNIQLDALLMSSEATMQRIFQEHFPSAQMTNKILKILSRPLGGLNEVFALLELENCLYNFQYESIILDTAPGDHFLDFLKSGERIHQLFNKNFMDVFQYLAGKKGPDGNRSQNLIRMLAQSGLKKLLSYLEYVTGKIFIKDFIDAINTVYSLKNSFLRASQLPSQIKQENLANWFLVTSVEHNKLLAAEDLREQISAFSANHLTLLINRCASHYLVNWHPQAPELQQLKNSLLQREESILKRAKELFQDYSLFQDINSKGPHGHLEKLVEAWKGQ